MSDGHWQLEDTAADLYERYLVPPITAKWAEDLLDRAKPREGEAVLGARPACATPTSFTRSGAHRRALQEGSTLGSDAISMIMSPATGLAGRSSFPRPYICRFTSFCFVIWPSVCPFDQGSVIAARTPVRSRRMPLAKEATRLLLAQLVHPTLDADPGSTSLEAWLPFLGEQWASDLPRAGPA